MKYDVINLEAESVGSIDLADSVFGVDVRKDILARVIQWQLDKRRQGTHKTKDIGEVSGNGTKPFKQKGTGRARQGQRRAPQMYHGGVVFGPVVRSHAYGLTKKIRALAMRVALSMKAKDGKLFILDDMTVKKPSTKAFQKTFDKNGWLCIGFAGCQPSIGESYINTGSAYLCCAVFVVLGLPADSDFWTSPAQPWTQKKVWEGVDIPCDKALKEKKRVK